MLKLQYFGHLKQESAHRKRPWYWERLRAGGEGDSRGWDGWMASPTRWTWVWANPGRWWRTGSLACCSSWGHNKKDATVWLNKRKKKEEGEKRKKDKKKQEQNSNHDDLTTYLIFYVCCIIWLPWNAWKNWKHWSLLLCLTLCDPMDCSPPGSSVHGLLETRVGSHSLLQGIFLIQEGVKLII